MKKRFERGLLVIFLKNYLPILLLCLLSSLTLLWGLGKNSLVDWDEAVYAQAAKEMVESGDWLTPQRGNMPRLGKPPLVTWTTAIFYRIFEVNEFWARAASAFSGIGLIIVTYLIGKFLYSRYVGLLAGLILLTTFHFVGLGRTLMNEQTLTLFIYIAIYGYLRLENNSKKWWYLIWSSCGLAFMVKSASGLIAPAAIVIALLLDRRLFVQAQSRHFWLGLLLAFVIVAPWHILMYLEHGRAFIDNYFFQNIMGRLTKNVNVALAETTNLYYFEVLNTRFFPWVYLAPFALALSIRENLKAKSPSGILLILIMLVFGVFSIATSRLPRYIFPIYPALAIIIAYMIINAFRSYKTVAFIGLALATCVVALIAPVYIVLVFSLIAGILVILLLLNPYMPAYSLVVFVLCAFYLAVGANTLQPLYIEGQSPVAKLARIAGSNKQFNQKPLISHQSREPLPIEPTVMFYSNRPIEFAQTSNELVAFTNNYQIKDIILLKEDMESLSKEYEINILAEATPYVYATIKLRSEKR